MSTPNSYHFVCFDCRKSFSYEANWKDLTTQAHICPQCGQSLVNMGRKFKPPRQQDVKQWKKIEIIRKAGRHYYPKYLWQAKNQVATTPPKSEGEKLLRKIMSKTGGKS
jgi:hypothetical protein